MTAGEWDAVEKLMTMKTPTTYDEYVDLVHQAVYEVDEMRASIEYDPEDMERWTGLLDHLDDVLRQMYAEMVEDSYRFPTNLDLPFMPVIKRFGADFPLKQLLLVINQTHKNGLSHN